MNSMLVCTFFFCSSPLGGQDIDTYKTKTAVEATDQTPEGRFGDDLLSGWLKEIVQASGSYIILPRKEVHYLILGTLKKARELLVREDPAVHVQFELWITELDPETREPALIPRINIVRDIERIIFFRSPEEAIKGVMAESFEDVKGGIAHEHEESEKNIYLLPDPSRHGRPYRTGG
jgi:hypothetical protein